MGYGNSAIKYNDADGIYIVLELRKDDIGTFSELKYSEHGNVSTIPKITIGDSEFSPMQCILGNIKICHFIIPKVVDYASDGYLNILLFIETLTKDMDGISLTELNYKKGFENSDGEIESLEADIEEHIIEFKIPMPKFISDNKTENITSWNTEGDFIRKFYKLTFYK